MATAPAEVAIIFDYDADAAWAVQPHGQGLSFFGLVLDLYKAMRGLGLSIDILLATTRDFTGYRLIATPGLMYMPEALESALAATDAEVLIGPRVGARDAEFSIPVPLPLAFPGLDLTVAHVESLRSDGPEPLDHGGAFTGYREALEGSAKIVKRAASGAPALMRDGRVSYLGGWPDPVAARRIIASLCARAGLDTVEMPDGFRRRDTGTERFWFNHTGQAAQVTGLDLPPISATRLPR